MKKYRIPLILALVTAGVARVAPAATIIKADNALPLKNPGSWVGNVVPGAADIARFDGSLSGPLLTTLGEKLTLGGIQVAAATPNITIGDDGKVLTLGSSGGMTTVSTMAGTLTILASILANNVDWDVGGVVTLGGGYAASGTAKLQKSGAGTLVLAGTAAPRLSGSIWIESGTIQVANDAAVFSHLNTLTLNSTASTFDLFGHSATVASLAGAGTVTNTVAAPGTLTLAAANDTAFRGPIVDGAGQVHVAITGGTQTLFGAHTYSGQTSVRGGTLSLDFSRIGSPATDMLSPLSALTLERAELRLVPNAAGTASQAFAGTALGPGDSGLAATGVSVSLGALSRPVGATLQLSANDGTHTVSTTSPAGPSGVLGWATMRSSAGAAAPDTWAAVAPGGAIQPLTVYSPNFGPTHNTDLAASAVAPAGAATGSLRFSGAGTLTLNGAHVIGSGGILVTAPGAAIAAAGPGDSLTSGNGSDLIVHQWGTGPFRIAAPITDNGATPVALTKAGRGTLVLSHAGSFSGGTFLNAGQVVVENSAALGTGPVTIFPSRTTGTDAATATKLLLAEGVNLPNNIVLLSALASMPGTQAPSHVGAPNASATLSGNVSTPGDETYRMGVAPGTLTLTGAHTAGGPGPSMRQGFALLYGTVVFAGNSSLTAYNRSIQVAGPADITLRDDAVFRVQDDLGDVSSTRMTFGSAQSSTLTLQDRAVLDLGPFGFSAFGGSGVPTVLNLNGGSIILSGLLRQGNVILNWNGTTLVAGRNQANMLPTTQNVGSAFEVRVQAGGARVDTHGHSVRILSSLVHAPNLGDAPDGGLTKLGAGTLVLSGTAHSFTGPLSIQQGTVVIERVLSDGVTMRVNSVQIARNPDQSPAGTLDLLDSKLVVASVDALAKRAKADVLLADLRAGRGEGAAAWVGKGITSATAAADPAHLTVSLLDNADLHLTTWGGAGVDENSLLLTVAPRGDTNLDGKVDAFDLNALAAHWQQAAGATASSGDFNLDGKVDAFDLNILASQWQYGAGALEGKGFSEALAAVSLPGGFTVPEPATLAWLGAPWLAALCRRGRGRRNT